MDPYNHMYTEKMQSSPGTDSCYVFVHIPEQQQHIIIATGCHRMTTAVIILS